MERRNFIKSTALLAFTPSLAGATAHYTNARAEESFQLLASAPPETAARMEEAWDTIGALYDNDSSFINLENGYCSTVPITVLDRFIENSRMVNRRLTRFMRTEMMQERKMAKMLLSVLCGTTDAELALVRNTTEALNILIQGIDLKPGDEVLLSKQDYGSMIEAFEQKAKRTGTVNNYVKIPLQPKTDQEIIDAYAKAITPKTKMMLVTHVINITGQVMPVKQLCELGKSKGIEVMVDGAHAFGQLDFKISDLGCDYYATSLHKWFGAVVGAGLLYIRSEKIANVWPLMGDTRKNENDIEKLEHIGTNPPAVYMSVNAALEFQNRIGLKTKQERLRMLKDYWVNKVKTLPGVKILSPLTAEQSCAIATLSIDGFDANQLATELLTRKQIYTVAIDNEEVKGVRVTPHLYTKLSQLDLLVEVITELAQLKNGPAPAAKPKPASGKKK